MAKFKKQDKKLKKTEEHYLVAVLSKVLDFGFSKKDINLLNKKNLFKIKMLSFSLYIC